jgi:hypothetical protein
MQQPVYGGLEQYSRQNIQGTYPQYQQVNDEGIDPASFNNSLNYIFYELDKISTVSTFII